MFAVMAVVLVFRPRGLLGSKAQADAPHATGVAPIPAPDPRMKWVWAGLTGLLLLLPAMVADFTLVIAVEILIAVLLAASLHFIMGPGGMVSFGHALWFGSGAYAAALLVTRVDAVGMEAAMVLAPLIAGVLAFVVGWFCVRLSGIYLAMLTLAFAQIGWAVVVQWYTVTGGDDGVLGVWPSEWASGRAAYYYVTLTLVAAGVAFLRSAIYAPFGFALRAGRDSPARAEAIGIGVRTQQWAAFAVSGALAGLAGTLFVFSKGSVFPDEMAIPRSVDALVMVLLGGVQSTLGPLAGGSAFTLLHDWLSRLEFWRALLGGAIVVIVILFPDGIAGIGRRLLDTLRRERESPS